MTDTTIFLIRYGTTGEKDEFLQPVESGEIRAEVFATSVPVPRSEFYAAGERGFRPDYEFRINPADYHGEEEADVYDPQSGKIERCRIYRTYESTPDVLEVYCSRAAGLDEREGEP